MGRETAASIICLASLMAWGLNGFAEVHAREVVVYTSVDSAFSGPILERFAKTKGIGLRTVYQVEAPGTLGLVSRLVAEKKGPRCDVFWNSEIGRTIVLKKRGILAPYRSPSAGDIPKAFRDPDNLWTGFAARARVLIYNTDLLREDFVPRSIFELVSPNWRGRVALAYPFFGTTATHVAALYVCLGKERTEAYLRELRANHVVIVDGNSVVRDLVVDGRLPLGLTDTDDVNVAVQSGKPVSMIYPDQDGMGTLLIPNTVALIHGAPHPDEGKALIDYLLSREVESELALGKSAQMPLREGVEKPDAIPDISSITFMEVDYDEVAQRMDEATRFCRGLFVR